MAILSELVTALHDGRIAVDLTSPLHAGTPILELPEQFGQTNPFELQEISHCDDRGPAWYVNNIVTGEHTGTHFDAPVHGVAGKGREDGSQVLPERLMGPAVVIDRAGRDDRRRRRADAGQRTRDGGPARTADGRCGLRRRRLRDGDPPFRHGRDGSTRSPSRRPITPPSRAASGTTQ